MVLNLHDTHLSYVTNVPAYLKKYRCDSCGWNFDHLSHWNRLQGSCANATEYEFPGGFHKMSASIFDHLEEFDIVVSEENRIYPWFIIYDFEAILAPIMPEQPTPCLKWLRKHKPISVSVAFNVPDSKMPSASWMPIQKSTDREHDDMHGFHCRLGLPQCRIAMGVCNRRLGRSDWKMMMNWKMMNWKDSLTRKGRVLSHYGNAPVRNWLDCWVPSTSIVDRFPCSDSTVPSTTSTWSNLNLFLGCDETLTRTKIMTVKTLVKSASSRRGRRTHTSEHAASSFSVSASTWLVGCPIRPSSKPTKFRKPNFIFLKHGSITLPNWIFPLCILTTVSIRNWNRGTCSKWETKKIMMMWTMEMSMTRMTKYSMQDNIVSYMTFGEIEAWPHFVVSWSITSIWMSVLLYKQWKKCKKKFRSPHRPVQGGCLRSGHCSSMAIPEGTCCQNQLWFHTTSRQRSLLNHQAEHRRGSKHHIHLRCRGGTHFRPERSLLSLHQYHRIWCKWALPRLHRQRHAMQRVCQTKCSGLQARLSTLLLRHVPLDELSHGNGGGPYSPCTQSHQRSSHQRLSCGRLRPQHEDRVRIQQVLFSRKLSLQEKSR